MHCPWEIIDNGVDEALGGFCAPGRGDAARRRLGRGARRRRGILIDKEPKTGLTGVEVVATKLHAGGKVRRRLVRRHRRPPRRRLSVVNAPPAGWTSTSTARRPPGHQLPAHVPGVFDGEGPHGAVQPRLRARTRKGGRVAKGKAGTRIRFWPDRQIFTKDATFVLRRPRRPCAADLLHRARPELVIRDQRDADATEWTEEKFRHDGGIGEFCDYLATGDPVTEVSPAPGQRHLHRDRAAARRQGPHDPAGRRARAHRRRRGAVGHDVMTPSCAAFVNVIATPKGGTHVSASRRR